MTFDLNKLERILRVGEQVQALEISDSEGDDAQVKDLLCTPEGILYVQVGDHELDVINENDFRPPATQDQEDSDPDENDDGFGTLLDLCGEIRGCGLDQSGVLHAMVGRDELVRVRGSHILSRHTLLGKIYAVAAVDAETTYLVVGGSDIWVLRQGDFSHFADVGEFIEDIVVAGDDLYAMLSSGTLQRYHNSDTPAQTFNLLAQSGNGPFVGNDNWYRLVPNLHQIMSAAQQGIPPRHIVQGDEAIAVVQDGACVERYGTFYGDMFAQVLPQSGDLGGLLVLNNDELWHCAGGVRRRAGDLSVLCGDVDSEFQGFACSQKWPGRIYAYSEGNTVRVFDIRLDYLVTQKQMAELRKALDAQHADAERLSRLVRGQEGQ